LAGRRRSSCRHRTSCQRIGPVRGLGTRHPSLSSLLSRRAKSKAIPRQRPWQRRFVSIARSDGRSGPSRHGEIPRLGVPMLVPLGGPLDRVFWDVVHRIGASQRRAPAALLSSSPVTLPINRSWSQIVVEHAFGQTATGLDSQVAFPVSGSQASGPTCSIAWIRCAASTVARERLS
jgi:hypothetical protein